jgi:carboxymethylenebutenolidase
MCFDLDSRPPIEPIAGGALDHGELTLTAADGNRFAAFQARASQPSGAGILVLPDVRGLHPYYEELALRFAEAGIDSLAIDYFGRTAGAAKRGGDFEYMPHVGLTTADGLGADVAAAAAALRGDAERVGTLFSIGFCFGGRLAFLSTTFGLDLAGAIGFYGWPLGGRPSTAAPADVAGQMRGSILGIFGGADEGIPAEAVATFAAALTTAGVSHDLVTYPGAPHSFFDRKAADFAEASADAWRRTLDFIRTHQPGA